MIVMKFGGTSVQDAAAIKNVARIITREIHRSPLVVLSACSGITNALVRVENLFQRGLSEAVISEVGAIRQRHLEISENLFTDHYKLSSDQEINALCNEIELLVSLPPPTKDLAPRLRDHLASFGERLSSLLLSRYLDSLGTRTHLIDARTILITNDEFTNAVPDLDLTGRRVTENCSRFFNAGEVVVTQGFIGATIAGATTTIGRGGSDYSAAIFGAALDAEEIQIWTDVDGILTADPSIIPEARSIKHMTFREAAELAYFGAKVLHPKTILPAVRKEIPVRVLNSRKPQNAGTLITNRTLDGSICVVKSIAYKEAITTLSIESTRMLMAHGFLAKLFDVFARYKKSVDVISTSEIAVSLTVDDDSDIDKITRDLRDFAEVTMHTRRAVLCLVGENMKYTRGIAARIFAALDRASVNVEVISQGGSDINLTLVICEEEVQKAVRALHDELFQGIEDMPHVFQPLVVG